MLMAFGVLAVHLVRQEYGTEVEPAPIPLSDNEVPTRPEAAGTVPRRLQEKRHRTAADRQGQAPCE